MAEENNVSRKPNIWRLPPELLLENMGIPEYGRWQFWPMMTMDYTFIMNESILATSLGVNFLLLFVYFYRPLRINTSKYFVPITAIQNIIYSLSAFVSVPRAIAWNYCWVMVTSGTIISWALNLMLVELFLLNFWLSILTTANSFLHKYLQICKSNYFFIYSSLRGFLLVIAVNVLIIINWSALLYFVIWPTDEIAKHLKVPIFEMSGLDITTKAFVGFCVKPQVKMSHLIIIIDSMLTLPLIATLGIYWAVQINKFLKESSFSSHTKAMQRRMNNLMIIQTACPVLLLHAPAFGQYILVLLGSTSNTAVTYFSQTLWTVFPVFSALVIMAFFRP